ncbi:MAG: hypothetical protein KatS3mg114_0582 [Planctomycetaceae bacterium]|nr:MAG: hypothetical protein KatS3mg114_0582 [Planctomycetaceae bacterium]
MNGRERHPRLTALMWVLLGCLGGLCWVGCGPPRFPPQHLRWLSLLQTAISAQRTDWVEGVDRAVRQVHQTGDMTETEFRQLSEIIELARQGKWETAERWIQRLIEAQRGGGQRHRDISPEAVLRGGQSSRG